MPRSRKTQVSLDATPYYYCSSRCVRCAFLCGKDAVTGQSFAHRRQWIEDKLIELSTVFAIDLCAYSVMYNHYHVVLFIDKSTADNWDIPEVVERWHLLFSGTLYSQRFVKGELLTAAEQASLDASIALWCERLMDISWFMRIINEGIARMANRDDNCTGCFWEGRFSSQASLDEKALTACSAYVDLNPIRAGIADSLTDSDHTSIKRRCEHAEKLSYRMIHSNRLMDCITSPVTLEAICQTAYRFDLLITWNWSIGPAESYGMISAVQFLKAHRKFSSN
jgi:REP element-mobilizing transposase RayT